MRKHLPVKTQNSALTIQLQVLGALMIRDMKTRFGGSYWGYVIAVIWPCAHIIFLVIVFTVRGLQSPLGDSTVLFIATGTTPYITYMYMSRKTMEGIIINKPLVYFPAVSVFDILLSRAAVETITAFATTAFLFALLVPFEPGFWPVKPIDALEAYFATILISFGMGIINSNIIAFFPGWGMGYVLVIVAGYSASGVFFLPDLMPEKIYNFLSWNPMLQCISWFRSGFYFGYGESVAKLYTILSGLILVMIGFILERFVTRKRIVRS